MIKTEELTIGDETLVETYSDENFYIKKVGTDEVYSKAIDLPTSNYTYEETGIKIVEIPIKKYTRYR